MYCNGYIYTKSRFLGLSLGVHNIGEATLHLLDYDDEQYVVTLPSAYGRSVYLLRVVKYFDNASPPLTPLVNIRAHIGLY